MGNDATVDHNACSRTIVNMSEHTSALVAFIDSRDQDIISFAHSPVFHPNNPTHNLAHDDHVVLIMGDSSARASALLWPLPLSRVPLTRVVSAFLMHCAICTGKEYK